MMRIHGDKEVFISAMLLRFYDLKNMISTHTMDFCEKISYFT